MEKCMIIYDENSKFNREWFIAFESSNREVRLGVKRAVIGDCVYRLDVACSGV